MRRVVRSVPRKRRYLALAILALAVAAAAAMTTGAVRVTAASATDPDTCGYSGGADPTKTPTPARPLQKFNEIGILEGLSTTNGLSGNLSDGTVNVFYSDEHALTIGVTGTTWVRTYVDPGTTITRIDDAGTNPAGVHNPSTDATSPIPGTLDSGPPGTDLGGREVAPMLYLTDEDGNTAGTVNTGDWQQNPTVPNNTLGTRPDYVGGTWKNNGAANPLGSDGKEAKNGIDLGPHSETFVDSISTSQGHEGYGAEVRWDVSDLTSGGQALKPGHTYRVQMMLHDGDHNADTGEACANITIPPKHPAGVTQASGGGQLQSDANDPTGLSAATHDTANLSAGTANAGPNTTNTGDTTGLLTFKLYKASVASPTTEAQCKGGTSGLKKTVTVTADHGADGDAGPPVDFTSGNEGVYDFPDVTVNEVGTYHWTVSYSGNIENAPVAETLCLTGGELVTVTKAPSKVETAPNFKITEDVHIKLTVGASAGIKAGDQVTIQLNKQDASGSITPGCSAKNTSGGSATRQGTTKTVTIAAGNIGSNGEVDLGQLTYPDDFGGNAAPALGTGDYWWFVSYLGNSQVTGSNDDCTEFFSIVLP
jgi:hypothetical protein